MRTTASLWAGALAALASATEQKRSFFGLFGNDPTAEIQIGQIVGTSVTLPSTADAVNKFLGIPYAVSPPERFSPPQKAQNLSEPLKTQSWKDACPQQFNPAAAAGFIKGVYNTPPPQESEDCLYLNVYAPSTYVDVGRPVFIWLPAGEMQFANGGQPAYDGSAFAAYEDVIVVTLNFRTNVFGFPNAPGLKGAEGNLGFMDQRMAIEWVQQNIASFGGDPKKVTVGGVSSGSWNAELLMYTYTPEEAPFRAVILESGNAVYLPLPTDLNADPWGNLTANIGCDSAADTVACVRTKSVDEIRSVIEKNELNFRIQQDNVTVPESPYQVIKSNNFNHVPVLTGSSSQEGRFYMFGQTNETEALLSLVGNDETIKQKIPDIINAYPPSGGPYANGYEAVSAVVTDLLYTCTTALVANNWAKQGVPVWQYVYNASFPNIAFSPDAGAYHASEVRIVFQTYSGGPVNGLTVPLGLIPTELPPTPDQAQLSTQVMAAWAAFIKDPQGGPGWDRVDATGSPRVQEIGGADMDMKMIDRLPLTQHCGFFLDLYSANSPGVPQLSMSDLE